LEHGKDASGAKARRASASFRQTSRLARIEDDMGLSRCARCLELCDRETGCWPDKTAQGNDCDYTKEKYRRKRNEVRP
jgi:hypothetical protein